MSKKNSPVDEMVGRRLKDKRQALGLSRVDLAEKVKLSAKDLGEYESGALRMNAATLLEISRVLGVPPQYFFAVGESYEVVEDKDVATIKPGFAEAGENLDAFEGRLRLHQAFAAIKLPAFRKIIVDLAVELSKLGT